MSRHTFVFNLLYYVEIICFHVKLCLISANYIPVIDTFVIKHKVSLKSRDLM